MFHGTLQMATVKLDRFHEISVLRQSRCDACRDARGDTCNQRGSRSRHNGSLRSRAPARRDYAKWNDWIELYYFPLRLRSCRGKTFAARGSNYTRVTSCGADPMTAPPETPHPATGKDRRMAQ
jgi:hypothetical protein